MKQMILRKLWRGNITPLVKRQRNSTDADPLLRMMTQYHDAIVPTLTDDQQEFFTSYVNCVHKYADQTAEDAFCEGFCLASKLMAEAFCEK